jgi:hypothetical protein
LTDPSHSASSSRSNSRKTCTHKSSVLTNDRKSIKSREIGHLTEVEHRRRQRRSTLLNNCKSDVQMHVNNHRKDSSSHHPIRIPQHASGRTRTRRLQGPGHHESTRPIQV